MIKVVLVPGTTRNGTVLESNSRSVEACLGCTSFRVDRMNTHFNIQVTRWFFRTNTLNLYTLGHPLNLALPVPYYGLRNPFLRELSHHNFDLIVKNDGAIIHPKNFISEAAYQKSQYQKKSKNEIVNNISCWS